MHYLFEGERFLALVVGAQVSRASDLQDGLTQQWVEMREKDPPESLLSSLFGDVPFFGRGM